jgi:hypothetical protein
MNSIQERPVFALNSGSVSGLFPDWCPDSLLDDRNRKRYKMVQEPDIIFGGQKQAIASTW